MKHYVGIDLHSDNSYIAVMNQKGDVCYKQRHPNDITIILNTLKVYKRTIIGVVIESTYNWYWLVDALKENGYQVHLANPAAADQYKGLKHTDDKTDAIWLAEMLRLGILPTGYIYPKEERALRDLLRRRTGLVEHRTALLLSLKGMLHNWTGERISRSWIKDIRNAEIQTMLEDENTITCAQHINDVIKMLDEKIRNIENAVMQQVKLRPEFKHLVTVWGIGPLLAKVIMLETGDIRRFADVGKYASYCRCVSSHKISNNKNKGSGNKRNGNRYLAWAYIEAAHYMKRYHTQAQQWFDKKAAKKGVVVATKALSNKIARACYFVIRDQAAFDPARMFA